MRRKDREITDRERILGIMASCSCCRLGLIDGDEPYIVPLNFGFETEEGNLVLYFHSASEGRKIDLIPRQSAVAFEMDTGHRLDGGEDACSYTFFYECVMGTGRIGIVDDREGKKHGLGIIMEHYAGRRTWDYDDSLLDRVSVLKLEVETISCKVHC